MKRTFLLISFFILIASSASAKTQGSQIGIDAIYTFSKQRYFTDTNYRSRDTFDDSAPSFGVTYKHAFNLDKILPLEPLIPVFIAPSIFYDKLGIEAKDFLDQNLTINDRYGAKIDIGLDIFENVAIYGGAGAAMTSYEIDWNLMTGNKKSGRKLGLVYGGGIAYTIKKHLVLSLEYSGEKVDFDTEKYFVSVEQGTINKLKTRLNIVKFGVAYRF